MKLKEGDLVRGSRPWNKSARYGVIIEARRSEEESTALLLDSFKVHWISPTQEIKQYTTWEVDSSLWKWQDKDE